MIHQKPSVTQIPERPDCHIQFGPPEADRTNGSALDLLTSM